MYRRVIRASVERVWENVLDWEHLPWLHASSFGDIECLEAGQWGWRARVVGRGASAAAMKIELLVDLPASRYVTRTLEGPGAGSEIWTTLAPQGERETAIEVDFRLAVLDPEHAEGLGNAYRQLYERLWDEDEGMMQERQRQLDARRAMPGKSSETRSLGKLDEVREKLPLSFELAGRRFRLVDCDGELMAHAVTCPHSLGPLDDAVVEDGVVRCPWHGYRYDLRSGRACDRAGLRLERAPRVEIHENTREVHVAWAATG